MSDIKNLARIAKTPLKIPADVTVMVDGSRVEVIGKLGKLVNEFNPIVIITVRDNVVSFSVSEQTEFAKAVSGTIAALLKNMIVGVSEGFEKKLQLHGVGYRVNDIKDNTIYLNLGFSHPIIYKIKHEDVKIVYSGNEITVKGLDKAVVGQVAAELRSFREPDPYKGKGLRYVNNGEKLVLKAVKKH